MEQLSSEITILGIGLGFGITILSYHGRTQTIPLVGYGKDVTGLNFSINGHLFTAALDSGNKIGVVIDHITANRIGIEQFPKMKIPEGFSNISSSITYRRSEHSSYSSICYGRSQTRKQPSTIGTLYQVLFCMLY